MHLMEEIQDHISLLQEQTNRAVAKPLEVSYNQPTISRDAHTQQLLNLEHGARSLREAMAQGCISGVKGP